MQGRPVLTIVVQLFLACLSLNGMKALGQQLVGQPRVVETSEANKVATVGRPRQVLAFYYNWYGIPKFEQGKWVHWNECGG